MKTAAWLEVSVIGFLLSLPPRGSLRNFGPKSLGVNPGLSVMFPKGSKPHLREFMFSPIGRIYPSLGESAK